MPARQAEISVIAPKPSFEESLLAADPSDPPLSESLRYLLFRPGSRVMDRDRRASPRVPTQVSCFDVSTGSRQPITTHDISTFGMATQGGPVHPIGTELDLVIQLPNDQLQMLTVRARVVGHIQAVGGMRLGFRNPHRSVVRRLHRFVLERCSPTPSA